MFNNKNNCRIIYKTTIFKRSKKSRIKCIFHLILLMKMPAVRKKIFRYLCRTNVACKNAFVMRTINNSTLVLFILHALYFIITY